MKLLMKRETLTTIDHAATGATARKERVGAGISLRNMADAIGLSAPYLSDLERGKRNWSAAMHARWDLAVRKATNKKQGSNTRRKK